MFTISFVSISFAALDPAALYIFHLSGDTEILTFRVLTKINLDSIRSGWNPEFFWTKYFVQFSNPQLVAS